MHFCKGRAIIVTFQFGTNKTSEYGGLAQLVRAPASHAGGLGFESLILHHTVRTRTRFSMRKDLGTFFVYRRFCGGSTQNGEQERTKAGYHHGGGALPFVVGQCTFVKTLSYYYNVNGYCISILHSSNTFDLFLRHDSEFHCISCDFLMKLGKLFNLRLKNSTTLVYFTPNMWRFATCSVLHFLVHNVIKTVANKMTLSRKFKKLILSFIKSAKYI